MYRNKSLAFLQSQSCKENFVKQCEIEYHDKPKKQRVEVCNERLNRDCDAEGEEVCSNEYETGEY